MAVQRQPSHGWGNLCAKSQAVYYEYLEEMLGGYCVAEYSHRCWLSATQAETPPSMVRLAPVTKLASGPAR